MSGSPRRFVYLALALSILAAALVPIHAQELKDRELTHAYDFTTVQMPVEIVAIRLNGKEIVTGEKIKGDDDWLRGISFTVKNISDQPIAYVNIGFKFPRPNGFLVYALPYGVSVVRGERRNASSPPAIQPGQSVTLVLTKERYESSFLYVLAQAEVSSKFDTVAYYVETVAFEDQPDVIWQMGYLKRRHPTEPLRFDVFERYVLPGKQQ